MWCFVIGFPILVIWVAFTPIFSLILLSRNIKKDDDNKIKQYMLILYQGLKPSRYYWEFVNTLRKVLILMSFSLFVTFSPSYKIMIAVIILIITFRIQVYLNPYKNKDYNSIEILALLTGTLTLSSGLIFTNDEDQKPFLNAILLIIVLTFNIAFVLRWTYLFMISMSEKYKIFKQVVTAIQYLMCKNEQINSNTLIIIVNIFFII